MRPTHDSEKNPAGLWQKLVRNGPRYGVGLVLIATYQAAQWWFDTELRLLTNAAVDGHRELALRLGSQLVLLAAVSFAVRVSSRMAIFNAGRHAEYEIRKELLEHLQRLGPSFYRRMNAGDVMSRATNDLTQVRLLLGFGVLNVINTVFALASALAVTLTISYKLTLAGLAVVPLMLLVMRYYSRAVFTRTRENQDAIGRLSELVQTSIAGVRVVRAFALEDHELSRFERGNRTYLEKNLRLARLRGALGPLIYAITSAGFLIVFWYGGSLMMSGELDEGGLVAFLRAMGRLTWPIISLGFVLSIVQRGRAGYSRIAEVLASQPDVVGGSLALPEGAVGRLDVRGLGHSYDGRRVLSDVTFSLPPGGSLAVVGRTGSGKSTLAALLTRLERTPRGCVFLDGVDVCDLPLDVLRGSFSYADQTAFLFSTTAGRNVGYSRDDPDSVQALAAVKQAATDARILDELLALPDGFNTVVGERGVQLSGGQRQRVALARAFVSRARILILDDPLSAVDAATEAGILEAIDRQRAERAVILITHRVAAAARCDQVLVLDHGRVVERGTHAELVARGGLYTRFAEEQRIANELEQLAKDNGEARPSSLGAAESSA